MEPRTLAALILFVVLLAIIATAIVKLTRKAREERELYHRRWMRGNDARPEP